jgi:hypothetical protein
MAKADRLAQRQRRAARQSRKALKHARKRPMKYARAILAQAVALRSVGGPDGDHYNFGGDDGGDDD